jgi:hypothetical protein
MRRASRKSSIRVGIAAGIREIQRRDDLERTGILIHAQLRSARLQPELPIRILDFRALPLVDEPALNSSSPR